MTRHRAIRPFVSDGFAGAFRPRFVAAPLAALALWLPARTGADEIWLHDDSRVSGWVLRVSGGEKIGVLLPSGQEREIPLEEVISIRFLGRDPLMVQAGTQEFRFVNGGKLRGQILGNEGDSVKILTSGAGILGLDLSRFRGFLALPQIGFVGRKAEDLVESERGRWSRHADVILDDGGGDYPGVVRRLKRTGIDFDVDDFLQTRFFPISYVRGVRLADAGRDERVEWAGDVQVILWTRDGSSIRGKPAGIHLRRWKLIPAWDPKNAVEMSMDEIVMIQVLGGRVQYLSQISPVEVKEKTVLVPPQPYKMDMNAQGGPISIAGSRYPWGIGVHADSEITFPLEGRYQEFRSDIGIDTRMGKRGSVVFAVAGDGKELYRSPVVRGSDGKPLEVRVPIEGVKRLTLKVSNAGDLDLGDLANWGAARVIRSKGGAAAREGGAEGRSERSGPADGAESPRPVRDAAGEGGRERRA
ncbi:MAG: NPCBM/NEW2 domain-containing protein [Planctomycetota bacterium]|nr:NPCBM/NEW2 domain-containing protein [Planctomycetota bacterium]